MRSVSGGLSQEDTDALYPAAEEAAVKKMVEAEVSNPLTKYETATAVAKLDSLRNDTLLTGNTIRGMLLNAYGWGLVGKVAKLGGSASSSWALA